MEFIKPKFKIGDVVIILYDTASLRAMLGMDTKDAIAPIQFTITAAWFENNSWYYACYSNAHGGLAYKFINEDRLY